MNPNSSAPSLSVIESDSRCEAFEARIHRLVHYDTLTGVPNLAYIDELVRDAIGFAAARTTGFAMVLIKPDDFGLVHEGFGRATSNDTLRNITAALTKVVGDADSVARIGVDEFLVILPGVTDSGYAAQVAQRLLESIANSCDLAGQDVQITASAGITIYPIHGADFETLLCNANVALREAQVKCRGGWHIHSGEGEQRAKKRLRLTTNLRHAIKQHELSLHYQPQFEVRNGRPCGVEALARWTRADGESVAPDIFIPHAEQTGLISALGSWVLQEACATVALWHAANEEPPVLCVNVSAHQVSHAFLEILSRALERTAFPAARLELEITESVLIDDAESTLEWLAQWKRLGVRIALDDFGTGFSSLSYLSRLPLDRLKVDKSLVQRMTSDPKTAAIVRSVILLGKDIGFAVLAEGVETEEQFELLRDMGCQQVQGYLCTPPACATKARSLMASRWGARRALRSIHAN